VGDRSTTRLHFLVSDPTGRFPFLRSRSDSGPLSRLGPRQASSRILGSSDRMRDRWRLW